MRIARFTAVGISLAAGMFGVLALSTGAGTAAEPSASRESEVAARAFLASLPDELRRKTVFPFESTERREWHFVPRERIGASLLVLDDAQSELLGPLLATALSPEGLLATRGVIKHENILREIETAAGVGNASRRDPGLYYTSIFGDPGAGKPWGWRFEGHHLSLNVTQVPGKPVVVAPLFMGANPARVQQGPQAGFRLLAAEEDLARELIQQLAEPKRRAAIISDTAFPDILTGNDPTVRALEFAGVAAADMTPAEQKQLRRLIEVYTGRLVPAAAQDMLARMDRAGFGKVHFAWAGSVDAGQKHYYRVHGPTLLIEYDNTQNDANHIHTVYRDLERDFGGDALRKHLASAPH